MDLVIVDVDSKNSYASEDISSLFGIPNLTVWYLNAQELADKDYLLEAVTGVSGGFMRVVLLTKASHGIMRYHTKMVKSNPDVKYWVISIPDSFAAAERKQIQTDMNEAFQCNNTRYAIIFDNERTLLKTAEILKEDFPEKPQCVLYYKQENPVVDNIINVIKIKKPEWDILCNPENDSWIEKYADRILLFSDSVSKFEFVAQFNNIDRVFIWIEGELGTVESEKVNSIKSVSLEMDNCGFCMLRKGERILYGYSPYELFLAEIESGAYSYLALKNKETFIMWDKYGLPLLNKQYEDANVKQFLTERCVLADFIGK